MAVCSHGSTFSGVGEPQPFISSEKSDAQKKCLRLGQLTRLLNINFRVRWLLHEEMGPYPKSVADDGHLDS